MGYAESLKFIFVLCYIMSLLPLCLQQQLLLLTHVAGHLECFSDDKHIDLFGFKAFQITIIILSTRLHTQLHAYICKTYTYKTVMMRYLGTGSGHR